MTTATIHYYRSGETRMSPTPRGRAAKFAFDGGVVAQFITNRVEHLELNDRRTIRRWEAAAVPGASRPVVEGLLERYELTERQLRDFARRRNLNVVLWDRTKEN